MTAGKFPGPPEDLQIWIKNINDVQSMKADLKEFIGPQPSKKLDFEMEATTDPSHQIRGMIDIKVKCPMSLVEYFVKQLDGTIHQGTPMQRKQTMETKSSRKETEFRHRLSFLSISSSPGIKAQSFHVRCRKIFGTCPCLLYKGGGLMLMIKMTKMMMISSLT